MSLFINGTNITNFALNATQVPQLSSAVVYNFASREIHGISGSYAHLTADNNYTLNMDITHMRTHTFHNGNENMVSRIGRLIHPLRGGAVGRRNFGTVRFAFNNTIFDMPGGTVIHAGGNNSESISNRRPGIVRLRWENNRIQGAVRNSGSNSSHTFTEYQDLTPLSTRSWFIIDICGGGGAGGGGISGGGQNGGGGGGGGGYISLLVDLSRCAKNAAGWNMEIEIGHNGRPATNSNRERRNGHSTILRTGAITFIAHGGGGGNRGDEMIQSDGSVFGGNGGYVTTPSSTIANNGIILLQSVVGGAGGRGTNNRQFGSYQEWGRNAGTRTHDGSINLPPHAVQFDNFGILSLVQPFETVRGGLGAGDGCIRGGGGGGCMLGWNEFVTGDPRGTVERGFVGQGGTGGVGGSGSNDAVEGGYGTAIIY